MSKGIAGFVVNSRRTGLAYGFFISAPQQHLGFLLASVEALVTSISRRQSGSDSGSAVLASGSRLPRSAGEVISSFLRIIRPAGQHGRNNNHTISLTVLYPNKRLRFYFAINPFRKGGQRGSRERSENPRFCKVV